MNAVEIKNLNYKYPDGNIVFNGLDLELKEGESLGIVGPNGAGKTSLLLCLSGLLDTQKMIRIFGKYLDKNIAPQIRKKISYVFQNPDDQLFMPTVYEDIAFGLINLGIRKKDIPGIVKSSLESVGMSGYEKRHSHHLSFGEKKRVCLASALARKTRLMFFDEPVNEFDPKGRREFIKLIKAIKQTKLIVCHDLNLVVETCSRTIVLNKGRIVASGKTKKILSDKKLMRENDLEVPYLLK